MSEGERGADLNAGRRDTARRNRRYALGAAGFAVAMIGLSYAAVPFYAAFCRVTGYEGTPQKVARADDEGGMRAIRVAFDTNVAPGLPWRFAPETDSIRLKTGKTATVFFRAQNLSDKPVAANAVFNVTPELAGAWFDKVQCFCFTEQHLGPHETQEWPVVFFLDPKLEADESMARIDSITLSYTLFAAPAGRASADPAKRPGKPS